MTSLPNLLTQAIGLAQARYHHDEWYQLSPRTRTAAIYEELARLDAQSAKASPPTLWERRKRSRRTEDKLHDQRKSSAR